MLVIFQKKNVNTLGTVSVLEPFSKSNMHSIGQWWKLDLLKIPCRQSNICTIFHMIMADVTATHLPSMHCGAQIQSDPKSVSKIKTDPTRI